jgi:hypothetical protein
MRRSGAASELAWQPAWSPALSLDCPFECLLDLGQVREHRRLCRVRVVRFESAEDRLVLVQRPRGPAGPQDRLVLKANALGFQAAAQIRWWNRALRSE